MSTRLRAGTSARPRLGDTCKPGVSGQSAEQLFAPQFVQVDPTSGDVYVGDTFQRKIHKYDEDGNLITGYGLGGALSGSESTFRSILGMAVTGSGQLVVRACQQNFCNFGEHVVLVTLEPGGTVQSVVSTPSEDYEGAFARSESGFMYYRGSYESTQYGLRRASSSDGSGVVNFLISPTKRLSTASKAMWERSPRTRPARSTRGCSTTNTPDRDGSGNGRSTAPGSRWTTKAIPAR